MCGWRCRENWARRDRKWSPKSRGINGAYLSLPDYRSLFKPAQQTFNASNASFSGEDLTGWYRQIGKETDTFLQVLRTFMHNIYTTLRLNVWAHTFCLGTHFYKRITIRRHGKWISWQFFALLRKTFARSRDPFALLLMIAFCPFKW